MKVSVPSNAEWRQQREKDWQDVIVAGSPADTKEAFEVLAARRHWFIDGDLGPLMSLPDTYYKDEALDLPAILDLCPIIDVDPYVDFIQCYCLWLSEERPDIWTYRFEHRDVDFISHFFFRYSGSHRFSSRAIFEHMLAMFLPDASGLVTFPLSLGKDGWQPKHPLALCDVSKSLLTKLGRYLFNDDGHLFSHLPFTVPFVKYIQDLDVQHYDTVLIKTKARPPAPPPTPRRVVAASQELIRESIGQLFGVNQMVDGRNVPLLHNDPITEQKLRAVIEGLAMPKEYYNMVEFIHAHPEDYIYRSEEWRRC